MNKTQIESKTILLRTIEQNDWRAILSYRSLPSVAKFQYWEPYTQNDALNFVDKCRNTNLSTRGEWIGLAIILKENDSLIGDCALKVVENTAELGCTISPDYQRLGIAQKVMQMLVDYCFHLDGINKVFSITDSKNIASIKLMEAIGMIKDPLFEETLECKGLPCIEHKYVIKN